MSAGTTLTPTPPTLNAEQLIALGDGALDSLNDLFETWWVAHGWQHAHADESKEEMRLAFLAGALLFEQVILAKER
jgi:hypothetical protein